MKIAVATRYHGAVLSYAVGTPVVGIAYQLKTIDLMRKFNQDDYAFDIKNLDLKGLQERFIKLESQIEKVSEKIYNKKKEFAKILSDQYDNILEMALPIGKI